jgi:hypothetical protein
MTVINAGYDFSIIVSILPCLCVSNTIIVTLISTLLLFAAFVSNLGNN